MPKSMTFTLKSAVLMVALGIEAFFTATRIFEYVATQDYFSSNAALLLEIGVLLLLMLWTHSLTVGGWRKWEQYVLVPLPISLGIFPVISQLGFNYAFLGTLAILTFLSYQVFVSDSIKDSLVKFRPDIILNASTKGILLVFSVLAAGLVLLHSQTTEQEINLGEKVGEFASGYSTSFFPAGLPVSNDAFVQIVEAEFNRLITPYETYINPLMALLVFTVVGFVGGLAGFAFSLTSPIVLTIFKKTGFLRVSHSTVEKEEIGFESSTA